MESGLCCCHRSKGAEFKSLEEIEAAAKAKKDGQLWIQKEGVWWTQKDGQWFSEKDALPKEKWGAKGAAKKQGAMV